MSENKTFTLVYKQLQKWFVNIVWPWIEKNILPILVAKIVEIFGNVADNLVGRLNEWLKRNIARANTAQKKAEEAEERSNSASSEAEAEKQQAIAEVWRQVAEQLRHENEVLKTELEEVTRKSTSDFKSELDSLDLENLIEEGEDETLRLKGSQTPLRLPSPTFKKSK